MRPRPYHVLFLTLAAFLAACGGGSSSAGSDPGVPATAAAGAREIGPAPSPAEPAEDPGTFRTIDGTDPDGGVALSAAAGTPLRRMVPADYADGASALAGPDRPGAREISNAVCAQDESRPSRDRWTDFVWLWGQFVDHDIDLTTSADPEEPADVPVPAGDPTFDPLGTGAFFLTFLRSIHVADSAPRQQVNTITGFLDASTVYGSDTVRAAALRALDGSGRLKTSVGDLLPKNANGLPNVGGTDADLFLAGDIRANEQLPLLAMHTLFVREHNRIADTIRNTEPGLSGEEIYQRARRVVAAEIQVITYREFLPIVLGRDGLPRGGGYDPDLDAGIANLFSTAAYRFGHSNVSSVIVRIDASGNEIPEGNLSIADAFFRPELLDEAGDVDPILRGLAAQVMQETDPFFVDEIRDLPFGPPGAGGLDLASMDIQRGRDHGLPSYNDTRAALGLARKASFSEVSSDPEVVSRLSSIYGSVDDVDVWIGSVSEDRVRDAIVGELAHAVIRDQFRRLRDGDRFWYERVFAGAELDEISRTRLADVIRRNTGIGAELRDDVWRVPRDGDGGPRNAPPPDPIDGRRRDRAQDGARRGL